MKREPDSLRAVSKSSPRQLGSGVAVQPALARAQLDVILDREVEGARRTDALDFRIAGFIAPCWHRFVRQVGDAGQQVLQLHLQRGEGIFAGFQLVAQTGNLGHDRHHVLATRLGLADGLGTGIALRLQFLGAGLHLLALALQALVVGAREGKAAAGQARDDLVELTAQKGRI